MAQDGNCKSGSGADPHPESSWTEAREATSSVLSAADPHQQNNNQQLLTDLVQNASQPAINRYSAEDSSLIINLDKNNFYNGGDETSIRQEEDSSVQQLDVSNNLLQPLSAQSVQPSFNIGVTSLDSPLIRTKQQSQHRHFQQSQLSQMRQTLKDNRSFQQRQLNRSSVIQSQTQLDIRNFDTSEGNLKSSQQIPFSFSKDGDESMTMIVQKPQGQISNGTAPEQRPLQNDHHQKTDVSINVIARVRPLIPNEVRHPVCLEVFNESEINGTKTQIVVRKGAFSNSQTLEHKVYSFEKVLDTGSSQQQVFAEVDGQSLCSAFLNGQNCTIFVYGPTSTGKTFTMQGNVEDIINTCNVNAAKSQIAVSLNASPDHSNNNMSQLDEISPNKNSEINTFTPTKAKKVGQNISSTAKKRFQEREESPEAKRVIGGVQKPSLSSVAQEMMGESRDKGIIQRVVDHIYEKFDQREDLTENCLIKVSFLEIYKEHVTDLLEGHVQPKIKTKNKKNNKINLSSSFAVHRDEKGNIDETLKNRSQTTSNRTKAKTFYGVQGLDEIDKKKQTKMETDNDSPRSIQTRKVRSVSHRDLLHPEKKQLTVKENANQGVYIQNLTEIECSDTHQAYLCLLDGLKRKRMSQTTRNTQSSRSHTIFQVKMYMKPSEKSTLLLPQYMTNKVNNTKLVAKFNLIDLAGSERILETEKNAERIDEARFINKSLSALGNVVAALRTNSKHANQSTSNLDNSLTKRSKEQYHGGNSSRSSFHHSNVKTPHAFGDLKQLANGKRLSVNDKPEGHKLSHVPYRDSKLTHILKDCLGSNSFTHLIICLSPSYLCITETISTLAFTKNAKAVRQNIVENVQFKSDLMQRQQPKSFTPQQNSRPHQQQSSLLGQMAGNRNTDEEMMLKDILGELGGSNFSSGLGIKQIFQLTLEQLKKFKENQENLTNQIAEMKKAMEKDLSNPKTLQLITQAQSDSGSIKKLRANSFSSEPNNSNIEVECDKITPKNYRQKKSVITVKPIVGQALTPNNGNYLSVRHNTLRSISEEEMSASWASPYTMGERVRASTLTGDQFINSKQIIMAGLKEKSDYSQPTNTQNTHPQNESELEQFNKMLGQMNKQQPMRHERNTMSSNSQIAATSQMNTVMLSSNGNEYVTEKRSESALETEPGEINDERTACGCSTYLQQYQSNNSKSGSKNNNHHQPRTSIIPEQNLQQLHQSFEMTSMKNVITRFVKNFLQNKFMQAQLDHRLMTPHVKSQVYLYQSGQQQQQMQQKNINKQHSTDLITEKDETGMPFFKAKVAKNTTLQSYEHTQEISPIHLVQQTEHNNNNAFEQNKNVLVDTKDSCYSEVDAHKNSIRSEEYFEQKMINSHSAESQICQQPQLQQHITYGQYQDQQNNNNTNGHQDNNTNNLRQFYKVLKQPNRESNILEKHQSLEQLTKERHPSASRIPGFTGKIDNRRVSVNSKNGGASNQLTQSQSQRLIQLNNNQTQQASSVGPKQEVSINTANFGGVHNSDNVRKIQLFKGTLSQFSKKGSISELESIDKEKLQKFGSQRASLINSNEFSVVVEEVQDNEILMNDNFMKTHKQNNPIIKSVCADSRTEELVYCPVALSSQFAGSHTDSQKKSILATDLPPTSLSSIEKDQNTTFFSNTKPLQKHQSISQIEQQQQQSKQSPAPKFSKLIQQPKLYSKKNFISNLKNLDKSKAKQLVHAYNGSMTPVQGQAESLMPLHKNIPKREAGMMSRITTTTYGTSQPPQPQLQQKQQRIQSSLSQSNYKIPQNLSGNRPTAKPATQHSKIPQGYQKTLKSTVPPLYQVKKPIAPQKNRSVISASYDKNGHRILFSEYEKQQYNQGFNATRVMRSPGLKQPTKFLVKSQNSSVDDNATDREVMPRFSTSSQTPAPKNSVKSLIIQQCQLSSNSGTPSSLKPASSSVATSMVKPIELNVQQKNLPHQEILSPQSNYKTSGGVMSRKKPGADNFKLQKPLAGSKAPLAHQ